MIVINQFLWINVRFILTESLLRRVNRLLWEVITILVSGYFQIHLSPVSYQLFAVLISYFSIWILQILLSLIIRHFGWFLIFIYLIFSIIFNICIVHTHKFLNTRHISNIDVDGIIAGRIFFCVCFSERELPRIVVIWFLNAQKALVLLVELVRV